MSIFAWIGVGSVVAVAVVFISKIITDVIDEYRYKAMAEEILKQFKEIEEKE